MAINGGKIEQICAKNVRLETINILEKNKSSSKTLDISHSNNFLTYFLRKGNKRKNNQMGLY